MTYVVPQPSEPLRQGDIFRGLRWAGVDLERDPVLLPDGETWRPGLLDEKRDEVVVQVRARLTWGIVITQDCDALRVPSVTFHPIVPFTQAYRGGTPSTPKKWMELITKHSKYNPHWFYLPADPSIGLPDRMAILFPQLFQIDRVALEGRRSDLRTARLDEPALAHFRECLSRFYSRLAYDEWYPLTAEEREYYDGRHSDEAAPLSRPP